MAGPKYIYIASVQRERGLRAANLRKSAGKGCNEAFDQKEEPWIKERRIEDYKILRALRAAFGEKINRAAHVFTTRDYELLNKVTKNLSGTSPDPRPHVYTNIDFQLREAAYCFDGLENVKGKRILDLGCGAETNHDHSGTGLNMFRPWFARALHILGAKVLGVDIKDLSSEPFKSLCLDLSIPGSLDQLPDRSFDAVNMKSLGDSPTFERSIVLRGLERETVVMELLYQTLRLLKPDGKIINYDLNLEDYSSVAGLKALRTLRSFADDA